MRFYEILQDGSQTRRLAATQVVGLFQSGCLSPQTRCKLAHRAEWQTIGELFPHVKYNPSHRSTSRPASRRNPFHLSFSAAMALVPLGAIASVIAGYLFFGARPSIASPITTSARSTAASSLPAPAKKQTRKSGARQSRGDQLGAENRHDTFGAR